MPTLWAECGVPWVYGAHQHRRQRRTDQPSHAPLRPVNPDEAVDYALRRLVGSRLTREQMLAMEGTGWDGELDQLREDPVTSS